MQSKSKNNVRERLVMKIDQRGSVHGLSVSVFSGVKDTTKIFQSTVTGLIYKCRKCTAAGRK